MTRKWKADQTQTGFLGWVRSNPQLDSSKLVVSDSDAWFHRYKICGNKSTQFLMLVEFKEFGSVMSDSQRDTLHIVNQLLRNRRNKRQQWQEGDAGPRVRECHSLAANCNVAVLCYGVHFLQIAGDGTYTQWQSLRWDGKEITLQQLEQLLMFEIDPDDFGVLYSDYRPRGEGSRHKTTQITKTYTTELGFSCEKPVTHRS